MTLMETLVMTLRGTPVEIPSTALALQLEFAKPSNRLSRSRKQRPGVGHDRWETFHLDRCFFFSFLFPKP